MNTLLREMVNTITFDYETEEQLNETIEVLSVASALIEALSMPDETKDRSFDELLDLFDQTIQRFTAARRGMSLVSKLPAGPDRAKHASRIMSHMNKIRGLQTRLHKKIQQVAQETPVNESVDMVDLFVEAKGEFKQLDTLAQKVWAATGNEAKLKAMNTLIDGFKFKELQDKHRAKLPGMSDAKLDKFAADLMQVGHGNKVL